MPDLTSRQSSQWSDDCLEIDTMHGRIYTQRHRANLHFGAELLSDGSESSLTEKHTAWPAAATGRQDVAFGH